jgi:hypothetical protein
MPKKLKDLVITKVALVPKGSNPDSDITLFKSAEPVEKVTFNDVIAGHPEGVREALWKIYDLTYAFNNTVYANLYGGKNVVADIEKSLDQFKAACIDALSNVAKGSKESADTVQTAVIAKAREFLAKHQETPMSQKVAKKREEMSKEELLAELDRVEKAAAPAPVEESTDPATVLKENPDLPEPIRKALAVSAEAVAKANATAQEALAKAAESEAVAKAEKDARRLSEMTAWVRKELPNVPGEAEAVAKSLVELQDKVSKESYDLTITTMKAGNAAIAKSMDEAGGTDAVSATGDAMAKMNALAKAIQEKDGKLSAQQAFSKACDENPDLYAEMRASTRTLVVA